MAKGLRSKSMRKNRAHLRATVIEPVLHRQQIKLSESLQQSIAQKKTASLLAIKKSLPKVTKAAAAKASKKESVESESDKFEKKKKSKKYSEVTGLKESVKGKAYKASRNQTKNTNTSTNTKTSKKELVWF